MAEFVQQSIEEMVGELHELQTAGLFDGPEIRYNYVNVHSRGSMEDHYIVRASPA